VFCLVVQYAYQTARCGHNGATAFCRSREFVFLLQKAIVRSNSAAFPEANLRRIIRMVFGLLLTLGLVAGAVGYWHREKLVRLYHVNTLFDAEKIVSNFSSMKDLFYWVEVKRSGEIAPLFDEKLDLPQSYSHHGETKFIRAWLDETKTTSLLVLREGRIAHEDYLLGTKAEDKRISWSMAKSFLSAMFGIAVADGRIKSLDDPVDVYVPKLKGTVYEGVTIRNVLNMASGVKFDEDYEAFGSDINKMGRVLALGGSMDDFAAGLVGRERDQGLLRQYTSIDTHILGMVLRAVTGKDLPVLMQDLLWSKLGVEDDAYYLTDGHGVAFALGGLNVRTRDYARFGQLMLNFGVANGVQIIPTAWAIDSVLPSAPPASNPDDKFGYGYQWWVPQNSDDEFYAIGIYGQYIYVNRPARVVIVKTSAHRDFDNDGKQGALIEEETIEMFRGIAAGISAWRPKSVQ
jgi:CubicO group peptidase (beta-lactamase class C family)